MNILLQCRYILCRLYLSKWVLVQQVTVQWITQFPQKNFFEHIKVNTRSFSIPLTPSPSEPATFLTIQFKFLANLDYLNQIACVFTFSSYQLAGSQQQSVVIMDNKALVRHSGLSGTQKRQGYYCLCGKKRKATTTLHQPYKSPHLFHTQINHK